MCRHGLEADNGRLGQRLDGVAALTSDATAARDFSDLRSWLAKLLAGPVVCDVVTGSPVRVIQALSGHEAIAILSRNGDEAARLVARVRLALPGQSLVAVVDDIPPSAVAALLMAGADDVFSARMAECEMRVRLGAIMRRRRLSGFQPDWLPDESPSVRRLVTPLMVSPEGLPPWASRLLYRLAVDQGRWVPAVELVSAIRANGQPVGHSTLKVYISRLRKRLRPDLVISNDRKLGYRLAPDMSAGRRR